MKDKLAAIGWLSLVLIALVTFVGGVIFECAKPIAAIKYLFG